LGNKQAERPYYQRLCLISERFFYQKIKDIYKTSIDYDPKNEQIVEFFQIVK
jgi:hypothetical protein